MQRQEEGSLKADSARGQEGGRGPWATQWEKRSWEEGQDSTRQSRNPTMELSLVWVSKACNLHDPEPSLPACSRRGRAHSADPKAGRAWPEIGGKTLPASCTKAEAAWLTREPRRGTAGSEGRARGRVNACTLLAAVKGPSEKKESLRLSQQMLQVIKGDTGLIFATFKRRKVLNL